MNYKDLLYYDIETVGKYKDFNTLKNNDIRCAELFEKKYNKNEFFKEKFSTVEEAYLGNASLHSTYGKIVCISFGYFTSKNEKG